METAARVEALYRSTLEPRIAGLESLRLSLKRYITMGALCVGAPFALYFLSDIIALGLGLSSPLAAVLRIGSFALIFAGVIVAGMKFLLPGIAAHANYRARFKREVAAEVFAIVCPSARYSPADGIEKADFDAPGLFNTRGGFKSDDRVYGTIGQTPFEAAEVRRAYSTGGKNSKTVVVFHGLFFHLDFNKSLRGVTLVQPENAGPNQLGARDGLARVTLEDPAFEQDFAVYASDEVEARYILTPAMMDQILALRQRAGKPIFLAFKQHRAYLGVHYGQALFEPGIAASTSLESIQEMAAHFALAEAVIHELDLNTRIWTKGVDASLLTREVDDEPEDEIDGLVSRGDVTASQLWEAAAKSIGQGADEPATTVLPPPGTTISIERGGGTTTVTYGLPLSFFVTLVVWAASVPIGFAAARVLPDAAGMPGLAPFTSWIPVIPYASALVAAHPIPWFVAAWILGPLAFTMWSTRVRKVEVGSDGVRIWRGLRPVPRHYPRPEYGKVVRIENAVYVGKTEGLNLINPSASPMLKDGEALWVAQELRRALEHTPVLR